MKKKLLATAITAAAATVSSGAFATVTVTTPNADVPRVAPGGTVVFENQVLTQTDGTGAVLNDGDKIVMNLPAGTNFSGTPTATASGSVKLESNSLGDPGDSGLVTLTDTNGDGLNDRMQVTVAKDAAGSADTVTLSGSLTYSGTSTKDDLKATIFVEDSKAGVDVLSTTTVLATRVASLATPLAQTESTTKLTIPATTADPISTPSPSSLILTVPAGKSKDQTVILTLGTGLEIDEGATIGITALTDGAPSLSAGTTGTDGDNKLTFTLGAATTKEVQYLITIDDFEVVTGASAGAVAGTLSGTAGLTGSATVAVLANSGSTVKLATSEKVAEIVAGADKSKDLPNFTISENFGGDLAVGKTITLVPSSGLEFDTGSTLTFDFAGGITATGTIPSKSKAVLTIATNDGGITDPGSITVKTLSGLATSSASGDLTIQVGDKDETNESANVSETVLTVAKAVARGAVAIKGPTTLPKVGAGSTATATITLDEATYGAINAATPTTYIQVVPPAGVTINSVTGAESTATSLDIDAAGTAATPADGSYILEVNSESDAPADFVITVNYKVGSSVASGTDVVFTLGGTANVSGTAKVASVSNTTTTTVGAIPSVDPGSVNAQTLAPFTIKENFASALTTGQYRVIAPSGVTFTGTTSGTSTVATTFSANDTLLLELTATGGTDTITRTPRAIISSNVAVDSLLSFTIADGDGGLDSDTSNSATGLVGGTVNLAYTGDVGTLDAGGALAVRTGFTVTNAIEGGLAPFTVATSDDDVATATVSDRTVTVTGVGVGNATITITDELGSNDSFQVTVSEAAAQTSYSTGVTTKSGATTNATFAAGVSSDGGATFDDEFTTGDEVDIVGTVNPDPDDVGEAGALYVVVRTQTNVGTEDETSVWRYMDVDGNFQVWNTKIADLMPAVEVSALEASHTLQIFSGELAEGTHKVFLGYISDEDGNLVYTSVPLSVTVTAP